jgi:hypothetical protein
VFLKREAAPGLYDDVLAFCRHAEDVLNSLGRCTTGSNESDRETATKLGINRVTLKACKGVSWRV